VQKFLLSRHHNPVLEVIGFAVIGWCSALLIQLTLAYLTPFGATPPRFDLTAPLATKVLYAISAILLAPILENGAAIMLFLLILMLRASEYLAMLLSAFLLSALHSLFVVQWGLIVFLPFLAYLLVYVRWRGVSKIQAFWMSAVTHSLFNLPGTVLTFFV
jgi:hypothetical protein